MGLLVGKKNEQIMVRVPKSLTEIIDVSIGNTHTSRPDFVTDGIRQYIHNTCQMETDIMFYLDEKMKDASREIKLNYYYESMKSIAELYKKTVSNAMKLSDEKEVSILLSLPKGTRAQIDRIVERTKSFRNHQEFIKASIVYLTSAMGIDNKNSDTTERFLESNNTTEQLKMQIEMMQEKLKKFNER